LLVKLDVHAQGSLRFADDGSGNRHACSTARLCAGPGNGRRPFPYEAALALAAAVMAHLPDPAIHVQAFNDRQGVRISGCRVG
jgi:hypothetical protein